MKYNFWKMQVAAHMANSRTLLYYMSDLFIAMELIHPSAHLRKWSCTKADFDYISHLEV